MKQKTETAVRKETQDEIDSNKAIILLIGGHSRVRKGLMELINLKADVETCIEIENFNESWKSISQQQVDLAIIDVSSKDTDGFKIANKIKLEHPNVPILLLSVHEKALNAEYISESQAKGTLLNREATEQIIKAIDYAQSLLRSHIFGFTLVVNLEGIPQDDY